MSLKVGESREAVSKSECMNKMLGKGPEASEVSAAPPVDFGDSAAVTGVEGTGDQEVRTLADPSESPVLASELGNGEAVSTCGEGKENKEERCVADPAESPVIASELANVEGAPVIDDVPEQKAIAEDSSDSSDDSSRHHRAYSSYPGRSQPGAGEEIKKKDMDESGRSCIMELHRTGRNISQIKNFYQIADYCLSEESIVEIIRGSTVAAADGGGMQRLPQTYSSQELREWFLCVKGSNLDRMQEMFIAHPSLLNAPQPGIGNSALHFAAARDSMYELRFLLENKANILVYNSAGATPLHSATMNGSVNALSALLEAGADVSVQDESGDTPREAAEKRLEALKKDAPTKEKSLNQNSQQLLEAMVEIREVMDLYDLIRTLRADSQERPLWTTSNLNKLLSLANINRDGIIDKSDLSLRVQAYLEGLEKKEVPLRQPKSFFQTRYGGGGGEGGADKQKTPSTSSGTSERDGDRGGGNEKAEKLKNKGNEAFGKGEWAAAIRHYTFAIRLDAENHVLYSNRSAAYAGQGEWIDAESDANMVIEMQPKWAKGYSRKAVALAGMEKYAAAVETYKKGLKYDPNNEQMKAGLRDVESKWVTRGSKRDNRGGGISEKAKQRAREAQENEETERLQRASEKKDNERAQSMSKAAAEDKQRPTPEIVKPLVADDGGCSSVGKEGGVGVQEGKAWMNAARKGELDELKQLLCATPQLLSYQGAGTKYAAVAHGYIFSKVSGL